MSYYVLAYRGFPCRTLEGFLITVALADLNAHTQAREVTQQEGGKADSEKERKRDLSQAFSPPISPRPRPNALPHNTLTAAGRQEHYDLLEPQQYLHTEYLYLFSCVCAQVQIFFQLICP